MEKQWSAVCALILALGAFVDLNTADAANADRNSTTKPGVCPRRRWGSGLCAEYCSKDSDCPRDEKCCHNGCGHECTAPYTVKPGRCALPQAAALCAEFCYHDGQCPGEHKCCRTSCGHACTQPC